MISARNLGNSAPIFLFTASVIAISIYAAVEFSKHGTSPGETETETEEQ